MPTAHGSSKIIVDALWKQADATVRMPETFERHSAHKELLKNAHAIQRTFDRYEWQARCILLHNETLFGIVTRDLSRSGLSFYSPIEIRPGTNAEVVLPGLRILKVKSLHTVRLDAACFECGVCFNGNEQREPIKPRG